MAENSVDSIVTDPPYGLTFMGKDWDRGVPGAHFWTEARRVAKPGAHLLAFGGTRTFHRLACAIEDAGWEIRDTVMWVYGSGFPKSHNLKGDWQGWGTALKPAWEPIIVARKPLVGTVAANVLEYETGALNIDGCRVGTDDDCGRPQGTMPRPMDWGHKSGGATFVTAGNPAGRWPANLIHDGSDEVLAGFPAKAGAFAPVRGTEPGVPAKNVYGEYGRHEGQFYGDSGSAARFFYCAKASKADRDEGCEELPERRGGAEYRPNNDGTGGIQSRLHGATTKGRNNHPTVKPTALMRYLVRLVTPPGGVVLDPFMGSGSTGKAAALEGFGFVGVEIDAEYLEIARLRIAKAQEQPVLEGING
jgi:site-specific DNA-methyltransferase (adenine-specific)